MKCRNFEYSVARNINTPWSRAISAQTNGSFTPIPDSEFPEYSHNSSVIIFVKAKFHFFLYFRSNYRPEAYSATFSRAYGLPLRLRMLDIPFCFIVRSSVRFCAHLSLCQVPPPSRPPSLRLTLCTSARFFLFLTFSFLQCLKMQK